MKSTELLDTQASGLSHERYLYRGYLKILALDVLNNDMPIHALYWDPSQPVATRPLALRKFVDAKDSSTAPSFCLQIINDLNPLYALEKNIRENKKNSLSQIKDNVQTLFKN